MALTIAKQKVTDRAALKVRVPQNRDRDEDQKAIDSEVQTIVHEWHGMAGEGKPHAKPEQVPVEQRPVLRFAVPPDQKSDLKGIIRRAATLHKVDPVWFEDAEDKEGRAVVTFTVGPKTPAKPKKK